MFLLPFFNKMVTNTYIVIKYFRNCVLQFRKFEIALLHALTVTLIVHRGKARYSRFEDLSDVSLSRNRCRRVYLDQKPTKLGNLGAP